MRSELSPFGIHFSISAAESAPTANARVWLIVALAVAGVAAIGYLV